MDAPDGCLTDTEALAALLYALPDGGEVPLLITGESMVPFYRHRRTTVILRREKARSFRRGDAVLFLRTDRTPVLHRVVKVTREGLRVGGDGQRWVETIAPAQILARVVGVRRSPASRMVSTDAPLYRLLVSLWSCGRWWHPRAARWIRRRKKIKERRICRGDSI